ncbi:MAG: DUF2203 family protein [Planctomycetota bacterium]
MNDLHGVKRSTVDEVNARVPLLRRIVRDANGAWLRREDVRARRLGSSGPADRRDSGEAPSDLGLEELDLTEELRSYEREIRQLGGILSDPESGTVDFFSLLRGRLVFLTWRLGDERVAYWREIGGGVSDRKPLPEDPGGDLHREKRPIQSEL